jgi:hypothetical protein
MESDRFERLCGVRSCVKHSGRGEESFSSRRLIAVALACFLISIRGSAAANLPEASEVTRRIIERAQAVAQDLQAPPYTYEKRSLIEHLDAGGRTLKSEEKIHQVTLMGGLPFNRLVRVQGRELTREELRKEQRKEERFQQRFAPANATNLAARKEGWVTPQLLDRYQFEVKERIALNNRATLVLGFQPKPGKLPEKAVQDKLLNRLAGTVWVDEEEADAARLSVHLIEAVSLGWFGVLGSLSQCEVSLERKRMPEGVWINARQTLLIQCRKLAATMRFRILEESSGFKKAEMTR